MVYRSSMIAVLALLMLSTAAPSGAAGTESVAPVAGDPAPILALDPRMETYDQFRGWYEIGRFEEALPLAKRVVELSEIDPERDYELPIAYNNLAATQYQLGEYAAAGDSYRKSLELLESTQGISSRRMIVPLAGLGAVHAALDQHDVAALLLERALAVSRRADGLFNLAQLPLIDRAAESLLAINDFPGVERERLYAIRIAEQNFGYGEERTLPAILKLASFYEEVRDYISARLMYLRARDVSMKESGGFNPQAISSLVGIARTHRMQYTMYPETLEGPQAARDPVTGEVVSLNNEGIGKAFLDSPVPPMAADRSGLKSAQSALDLLRATPDPPRSLLIETLIELGDWYQATLRPPLALPHYAEAAALLSVDAETGARNPLRVPRLVYYRRPVAAGRGRSTVTGQYLIRKAVFNLTVSETGEPQNIAVVSTDMSEGQLAQSRRAIARAIYSPRFVDGKALATDDVGFTAEWPEEHPAEPTSPPDTSTVSAGGS